MKIAVAGEPEETDALAGLLNEILPDAEIKPFSADRGRGSRFGQELRAFCPKLLITVNLAGFEMTTLRKGILYNLLDCKSLHLLTGRKLENEDCLSKQLSMAMFFFCEGEDYCRYLRDAFPDIPFLQPMGRLGLKDQKGNGGNAAVLREVLVRLEEESGLGLFG